MRRPNLGLDTAELCLKSFGLTHWCDGSFLTAPGIGQRYDVADGAFGDAERNGAVQECNYLRHAGVKRALQPGL